MTTPSTTSTRHRSSSKGLVLPFVIFGVVAVALLAIGAFYYLNLGSDENTIEPIMAKVTRGEFVSQVFDQGEIRSSENVEIRCEVRARNGSLSVLSVIPEGTSVKAGDFLVQLDSTSFEKELEEQNIALANAETAVIQAESNLESAKAAKEEYVQGIFEQNKKIVDNEIHDALAEIETAKQQLSQAEDVLNHSKKLQAKGFITAQQLEADKFAVTKANIAQERAHNSLALAQSKKEVLINISFKKETTQLDADIRAAEVKLISERKALAIEKEQLTEIEEMIEKCTIRVPQGVQGQVVYAQESRRGDDWVLEEGTAVRQNQVLVRLPNPEKMQVKALINEQSITRIEPNMPASIDVDALNDKTLTGQVTKVNQYAESSGWMRSNIRKYAVFVKILDPPPALKPGMNSSVSIEVQYEPDVLLAPIQTIYAVQNRQFCLIRKGENDWETREVEVAGDNSQMVYFKSGVEEGTELVMNPGAYKQFMDLPEIKQDSRILLPENLASDIGKAGDESVRPQSSKEASAQKRVPGQVSGFQMPTSGAQLISSRDTDGDGRLTIDEAGVPFNRFFENIDTDGDGFLSQAEADASVEMMNARRRNRKQSGDRVGPQRVGGEEGQRDAGGTGDGNGRRGGGESK